jgi:sporulation protein YlmC with PRC-barrel domain
MNRFKMMLIGMLVLITFIVVPSIGAQMVEQEGRETLVRASTLMDLEITDTQGNEIGSVGDLIVSRDGNVEYVVLAEGWQFLGIGEQDFIPIPWDMVLLRDYTEGDDQLFVNVDEETIRQAPTFTDEEYEAFVRGDMDQDVRGYYGVEERQRDRQDMQREDDRQRDRDDGLLEDDDAEDDQRPRGQGRVGEGAVQ